MVASQVSVPVFSGDDVNAGMSGSQGFVIFDPQCVPVAAYGPDGEGQDCGTTYELNYIEGKPLVVGSINWDVGPARFSFDFDGQHRRSEWKECGGCNTYYTDGGLRPVQQCKCSFYVGTCTLKNVQDAPMDYPQTKDALYTPQDSGNYQLPFDNRFSVISLYDSECYTVGSYRVALDERTAGCALPSKIVYFGDDKSIMIRKLAGDVYVDGWNVDEPAFTFEFNDRSYGSTDDWCAGCKGQGSDEELNQGCMCGFYGGE
ncbi:hypothetical protein LTR22_027600 [Elasticomyces elasticus]|nr:hypothetical protein LTR22_027600 [Elasticomyces elasticus]KAK4896183.1 hypothetical protein LTR49_028171 [Elasticomyces elasticus]